MSSVDTPPSGIIPFPLNRGSENPIPPDPDHVAHSAHPKESSPIELPRISTGPMDNPTLPNVGQQRSQVEGRQGDLKQVATKNGESPTLLDVPKENMIPPKPSPPQAPVTAAGDPANKVANEAALPVPPAGPPKAERSAGPKQSAGPRESAQAQQSVGPGRSAPVAPVLVAEGEQATESLFRCLVRSSPSWLVSMLMHVVIVLVMALFTMPRVATQVLQALNIATPSEEESIEPFLDEFVSEPVLDPVVTTESADVTPLVDATSETDIASLVDDLSAAANDLDVSSIADAQAQRSELFKSISGVGGSSLEGRGEASRAMLVQKRGGSKQSETAVTRSLEWLARHQLPDGGWSFNHLPLNCGCNGAGDYGDARNAATGIALMPFLGAGQTHQEGRFKSTVRAGLAYLVQHMRVTSEGGSLFESQGQMYSHGIASIALCEAYAMTRDRELRAPAEAALAFIVSAQDPVGGGWRYKPREPGDTSVVGWQMMSMKSALLAYLDVPPRAVKGTSFFLDSVQRESGSQYGYLTNMDGGRGTTAIGLLCRMYLGWKRDNTAIKNGVEFLSAQGPDAEDIYYNYYATQVMSHYGGEPWKKWNEQMRDMLVDKQATVGDEAGSWLFKDEGHRLGDHGGRVCCTALASMTLEVYYRYLPLYSEESTKQEFKD